MRVAVLGLTLAAVDDAESATVTAARRGDRAAWNALVARHDHRVVVALVAHGVAPALAREVAQEAWLRLIRQADAQRLDRLEVPGLVIRQALFLARSGARREEPPASGAAQAVEEAPSAEERYLSAERLRRAQRLLALVSDSAQRVFRLVYTQPHLSHAEVAAQVGLSEQRVRQIVCEVRKKLRAALEGENDG